MAINEALSKELVRLRTRYAKSPLPRFFAWWGRELLACLPARWRDLLAEGSEALLLETQGRELILWRQVGDSATEYGRISLDLPPEQQKAEYERLRSGIADPNLKSYYCIRSGRTLRRALSLPAAAEDNLRQVLAFEMDRQTPFKADQVYYDYRLLDRPPGERNLSVDLTVIPRAQLDIEIAAIGPAGAVLDGVDCWSDVSGGERVGLNLLPMERRARRKNLRLRSNLALAVGTVALLIVVMAQSLANRQAALAAMTAEVDKTQISAKQINALRKTLQDTIASANFLSRKKREVPVMVELLDDLSKRLPDDTFLERLNVDEKGKIELQGQSNEASKLVDLLQKSELLTNPTFQGTIQPDPRTKKERFNLTVEFRKKVEAKERKDQGVKDALAAGSKE
jgi:general secretion pathway protein L